VDDIDIDTGRRDVDWDIINEYRAKLAAMPAWRRVVHTLFI
jgi:amino acid transporter